jgi:MoaA/NifB/PqqE/SkfB family radical SAM enzyme
VKISWNGATKETHEAIMVGASWEQMLQNVRTFIAVRDEHARSGNRCQVTFQLTFLEANVSELADIVRLAAELGVDRVKGHHLWTHFVELEKQSMRRDPGAITRWNAAVNAAREVASNLRLPNGQHVVLENIHALDARATGDIAPGGPCPFLGQEAWVSAKGRFDPCCAPDERRRTLGEFGNLNERGLLEIWSGATYSGLLASYRTRALCVGCNMRRAT